MTERFQFGRFLAADVPLDADEAAQLLTEAREQALHLRHVPLEVRLFVLGKLGEYWKDPTSSQRQRVREDLIKTTGFSGPMIDLGFEALAAMLSPEALRLKVSSDLGTVPQTPEWSHDSAGGRLLQWRPLGVVLHVLSGNVFLVGPGSFVEGVLTGNVSLLKQSSAETVFLSTFMHSLCHVEETLGVPGILSQSVAVIDYPSAALDVISTLKQGVDGIVLWGGEAAVQSYRRDLPARCRMIVFGPKLSLACVTKSAVHESGVEAIAQRLARELAIWDQNACTAPQVCYVNDAETARLIMEALPAALARWQKTLPAGRTDANQAAEIQKLRGTAEISEIVAELDQHQNGHKERPDRPVAVQVSGEDNLDWTLLLDAETDLSVSPLHRTLRICVVDEWEEVTRQAEELRGYIQTVGLWATAQEAFAISDALFTAGALRVVNIGEMTGGKPDDPHDGARDLNQLMNLVFQHVPIAFSQAEAPAKAHATCEGIQVTGHRVYEMLPPAQQRAVLAGRLLSTLARRAGDGANRIGQGEPTPPEPQWAKCWNTLKVQSTETGLEGALAHLPILTRSGFEALANGSVSDGGYVTRTGGTTGTARFSYFDASDWQHMVDMAAEAFQACGFRAGDRMANCMSAGDLYGSFVSFGAVNERLGMTTFPFGAAVSPESFAETCRRFHINALQGMPSVILPLLRASKEIDPELRIEKVMYAGMPMSTGDQKYLREALGVQTLVSMIGTTEVGLIAYQTPELSDEGEGVHRVLEEHNYIELLNDSDEPCTAGEIGRLVVTTLSKPGRPVVRLDLGDQARWVDRPGPGRFLQYLGRHDTIIGMGMMNIHTGDLMRALAGLDYSALQMRVSFVSEATAVREEQPRAKKQSGAGAHHSAERLTVVLEVHTPSDHLNRQAQQLLLSTVPGFLNHQQAGHFELVVTSVSPGGIPRNPRTGKVALVKDERYKQ